jgi:nucleoside-diphosphate-sugar epimerase
MRTVGIVGASGFIGGHLSSRYKNSRLYGRGNIANLEEDDSDLIIIAAAPAEKWRANSDPSNDLKNIESLMVSLQKIAHKTCVLISTIDVFPTGHEFSESQKIPTAHPEPYGANRGYLELQLGNIVEDLHIIRLPGMFGPGLKKNLIYDIMNKKPQPQLNSSSSFQFYDVRGLPAQIELCLSLDLDIINLATEPVTVNEIYKSCFNSQAPTIQAPKVSYQMITNYAMEMAGREGPYLLSKQEVLTSMQQWIISETKI